MYKNDIAKSNVKPLVIVNKQVRIINDLLAEYDIFNELFKMPNISEAISLVISSRKFTDPFFDKNEIQNISQELLLEELLDKINSNYFKQDILYKIEVPKNRIEKRELEYYDLSSYALRYLIALILFKTVRISDCAFGGKEEIFQVRESEQDPYLKNNENFWSWQKEIIKSNKYNWVYIADIRRFYSSISPNILCSLLTSEFNITSTRFLSAFNQCYQNLTIGSMCDHFIQNLYLTRLDRKLSRISKIKYARLTDDIRVFCKEASDAEEIHKEVLQVISELKLSLNEDKQFIINPVKYIDLEPEKSYHIDFANLKYDETHKPKFSHYIKLSDIDKYDFENVLQLAHGTYDSYTWCNPKYDYWELPKNLTLQKIIDGNSGYKLGSLDINFFLSDLEGKTFNQIDIKDLENLGKSIYHSYGSYKYYFRLIRLYFNLLISITDTNALIKAWDKLILFIPYNHYKRYIFWYILFSKIENTNSTYYQYLIPHKPISENLKELVVKVFEDASGSDFLWSEIHYILKSGDLDNIKTETGEVFWKSESFWLEQLKKLDSDKNKTDFTKVRVLTNVIEILPSSFPIRNAYAEKLIDAAFLKGDSNYLRAYEELKYLLKSGYNISLFRLAYCCSQIDLKEEAMLYYTKYLKYNNDSGAYNNRALLFKEINKYDESIQDFNQAIAWEPEELYYSNRGNLLLELGKYEAAIKDFEAAYDFNKKSEFLLKKTECLLNLGKVAEAKSTYYRYYNENDESYGMNDPMEISWKDFQDNHK